MGNYENKLGNFISDINKDSSVPFVLNNNERYTEIQARLIKEKILTRNASHIWSKLSEIQIRRLGIYTRFLGWQ